MALYIIRKNERMDKEVYNDAFLYKEPLCKGLHAGGQNIYRTCSTNGEIPKELFVLNNV